MMMDRRSLFRAFITSLSNLTSSSNAGTVPTLDAHDGIIKVPFENRTNIIDAAAKNQCKDAPLFVNKHEDLRAIEVVNNCIISVRRLVGKEVILDNFIGIKHTKKNYEDNGFSTIVPYSSSGKEAWLRLRERHLSVKSFGAHGDGLHDDTIPIQNAISFAQESGCNLYFGHGTFKITSTIELSGQAISLIGEAYAVRQQGSARPVTSLQWFGSEGPMFKVMSSSWRFISISAENHGDATEFIVAERGQYLHVEDCSFVVGNGASRFLKSIFRSIGNSLGYSKWIRIIFQGSAPNFILIEGMDTPNGVTSMEISGGTFESNALGDVTIIKIVNEKITSITLNNSTYNQQANELCIVDTTQQPLAPSVCQLTFTGNEVDTANVEINDVFFKLTNVANAVIENNYFQAGGRRIAIASLESTKVTSFSGNYLHRCAGPFFKADSSSLIYMGGNNFEAKNTKGIVSDETETNGFSVLQFNKIVTLDTNYIPTGTIKIFRIDINGYEDWSLVLGNTTVGNFISGQIVGIQFRNFFNGKLGKMYLSHKHFRLSENNLTLPAFGHNRMIMFVWDGRFFVEIFRSMADVKID